MLNESDIFNDGLEGGVEPSINDTIRESIQYSFVSSEHNDTQELATGSKGGPDASKDYCVMNRMNWITYLKVLFDQLESFNQNKQRHVDYNNFVRGLKKIKTLLPLQPQAEYFKNTSDVAFSYKEVEKGVVQMPKYITWDNVIDVFLSKSNTASLISNPSVGKPPYGQKGLQPVRSEESSQPPAIDSSIQSSVQYEEAEADDNSFKNRPKRNAGSKINRNQDFFLSFADSVIKMQPHSSQSHLDQQQMVAQAPLTMSNPQLGMRDNDDDDEACEIDDNSSEDGENGNYDSSIMRRKKNKLEESVRSSRTATFKSIKGNPTNPGAHVQDSYYTIKGIGNSQRFQNSQLHPVQQSYYSQQSQQRPDLEVLSEDGQVEVASNANHSISSLRCRGNEMVQSYDEPNQVQEKSTRISSLNSTKKTPPNNNNTILSQSSNHSSSSKFQQIGNQSKSSGGPTSAGNNSSFLTQSNIVDIDLQGKGLRNFEIDFKQAYGEKKQLRAMNLSFNSLIKVPSSLERSLQFLNISSNKLKSMNGIEQCLNLKFLNVAVNQISTFQGLGTLQNLKELIFSNNQLSILKDIGGLRNLQLLDISYNKIIDFDKLKALQNLKKIAVLKIEGNVLAKQGNYEQIVHRMFPQIKVLDPSVLSEHSMFQQMESFCFTDPLHDQSSQGKTGKIQLTRDASNNRSRSRTPTGQKSNNQIDHEQYNKLKSTIISPRRLTLDSLHPGSSNNSSVKNKSIVSNAETTQNQAKKYKALQQYNDIQLRLNGNSRPKGGATSSRGIVEKAGEEETKHQFRERSVSALGYNTKQPIPSSRSPNNPHQQMGVKKVAVKMDLNNTSNVSGRATPLKSTIQAPRNQTYKTQQNCRTTAANNEDTLGTPSSQKRVLRAQESSAKRTNIGSSNKKNLNITTSPRVNKTSNLPPASTKNRPTASIRSKLPPQVLDTENYGKGFNPNQTISVLPSHPKTTKNDNNSKSFLFESGRESPCSKGKSQLHQFVDTSKNIPSRRLTNLPPKAYQSRIENPGAKKTKADLSQSRMTPSAQQIQQAKAKEESVYSISSRSLSPVCDEPNNVRKFRVDLTHYMSNRQ